ncbi:MAG TPA: LPXTG cell wall anchor domain-containing protein [Candidatus Nanoarchaeia archaeon]|nr:LPXTG cell wall anchor domain-containing protein [Candidatus Nanoarchaeia archaeon]
MFKNVELEYKSINEEIPSEEEPGQEEEVEDTGEEETSEKSYWYLYLIGGIIIIGLIVWFVYKKKK